MQWSTLEVLFQQGRNWTESVGEWRGRERGYSWGVLYVIQVSPQDVGGLGGIEGRPQRISAWDCLRVIGNWVGLGEGGSGSLGDRILRWDAVLHLNGGQWAVRRRKWHWAQDGRVPVSMMIFEPFLTITHDIFAIGLAPVVSLGSEYISVSETFNFK